jgi:hypothetical protein
MKAFLQKNKSTLLLLTAFGLGWLVILFLQSDDTAELFKNPQKGQVYVLESNDEYAPLLLDSITQDTYFFYDYAFVFKGNLPTINQIQEVEFNTAFYAIYNRSELDRLYEEGKLVKIFAQVQE